MSEVAAEADVREQSAAAMAAGYRFGETQPRARLAAIDAAAVAFCRGERRTRDETVTAWHSFRLGYVWATGRRPWLKRSTEEEQANEPDTE